MFHFTGFMGALCNNNNNSNNDKESRISQISKYEPPHYNVIQEACWQAWCAHCTSSVAAKIILVIWKIVKLKGRPYWSQNACFGSTTSFFPPKI
jgi:hypothetical protein